MCQRLPGSLPGRGKFGGTRYKRSGRSSSYHLAPPASSCALTLKEDYPADFYNGP